MRKFYGNPPEGTAIAELVVDGVCWEVYERHYSDPWRNLKVCAAEPVPRKANFWVGWSGARFGAGKDIAIMAQHLPELHERLTQFLSGGDLC